MDHKELRLELVKCLINRSGVGFNDVIRVASEMEQYIQSPYKDKASTVPSDPRKDEQTGLAVPTKKKPRK